MLQLRLQKDGTETLKFALNQTSTSLGRSPENDICLADEDISRTHFIIQKHSDQTLTLTDKSSNGTFLNNERVSSSKISLHDTIAIGAWTIVVEQADQVSMAETQIIKDPNTKALSYNPKSNELIEYQASMLDIDRKKEFPLKQELISIGKSKNNSICVESEYTSNFHCKIELKNNLFFIKDLNSTNGTFVNNSKIVETSLNDGDIVSIGKQNFQFKSHQNVQSIDAFKNNTFHGIISSDDSMKKTFSLIDKMAASDATVLIQGETGSGKELIAQAIHKSSSRHNQKYITINCGAIAKDLIESELFGHEKGAFTSALSQRKGVFEEANYGTLFLDEIGELPLDLQPKLLRVLENKEIRRVGSNKAIKISTRIVAASHKNLHECVLNGSFREDLYYRLYIIPIHIPPLRDRVGDIALISEHILNKNPNKDTYQLTAQAIEKLNQHHWPGNVRELKNVLNRAQLSCQRQTIGADDIEFSPLGGKDRTAFEFSLNQKQPKISKTLQDVEREIIVEELKLNQGNHDKTASKLGIDVEALRLKLSKYGL